MDSVVDKDGLITQSSSSDGHGICYGPWISDSETIQNTPSYHKACFGGQMLSLFLVKAGISTNWLDIRIGVQLETRLQWISSKFGRAPIRTESIGNDDED